MRKVTSAVVVAAVTGGSLLVSSTPSMAAVNPQKNIREVYYPKKTKKNLRGRATCWIWTSDGKVKNQYAHSRCKPIKDLAKDKAGIYVHWWQDGFKKIKLKAGADRYDARYNRSGSFKYLRWKVCMDRNLAPDPCSSTVVRKVS